MVQELTSFVCGDFHAGTGARAELLNPATEEVLATASTEGIDMGAAIAFARETGGAELAKTTFADRGAMLKALSRSIIAHRDELLDLAMKNGGNTRSDGKFDVDGASGTLEHYAELGAALGASTVMIDGEGAPVGRSARLFGQHAFVPRAGVAVHVNAFNFPAWGLAEKAACAILAGMPVVSKPATSTALVAHRMVEIFVAEKLLPPGVLSLVTGGAGDLLDKLGGQDVLAFTGSHATGKKLRTGAAVLERGTRVNVEADSLNAAVLGPDVEEGSDTESLFLADVTRDITQKTGQKCTAIRRVYVPRARLGSVVTELSLRLAKVRVGDTAHAEVTMGPVSTAQQHRDVKAGIGELAGCSKIAFDGSAGGASPLGQKDAKGFFQFPVLLVCESPTPGDAVHTREVFGPVATVMPYDSPEELVRLVGAGGGGLVSSVYSDDKAFLRKTVLGIAAFHGRVTLGSAKIAGQAIPPGTVMPQLLHGGPGRAGAGEELGGRRGVGLYMQRVALQGDKALVDLLLGSPAR